MATSADSPVLLPHPSIVSTSLHLSTVSTSVAEVLSTTTASIQTSPITASLSHSSDGLDNDRSAASNSEIDRSTASNNSITQSPQPQTALQPPTFQELPPLPTALQQTTPSDPGCPESAMGAEANQNYANAPCTASKSENLRHSIGHLKQEMRNLRNADLALLSQLNDLHQQIMTYKVAMAERQSETNSEYSNSFAEDYDFEDIEEDDDDVEGEEEEEEEEERETRYGRMLMTNGGAAGEYSANVLIQQLQQQQPPQQPPLPQRPSPLQNGSSLHQFLPGANGSTQQLQHGSNGSMQPQQQHGPNGSQQQPEPSGSTPHSPRPRNHQHSVLAPAQSVSPRSQQRHSQFSNNPHRASTSSVNFSNPSSHPPPPSTASRSSLRQLRQQLPPPPPRPANDPRQEAGDSLQDRRDSRDGSVDGRRGNEGEDVNQWVDLNFQPDSYNC